MLKEWYVYAPKTMLLEVKNSMFFKRKTIIFRSLKMFSFYNMLNINYFQIA